VRLKSGQGAGRPAPFKAGHKLPHWAGYYHSPLVLFTFLRWQL
jgi:hypothetical protein